MSMKTDLVTNQKAKIKIRNSHLFFKSKISSKRGNSENLIFKMWKSWCIWYLKAVVWPLYTLLRTVMITNSEFPAKQHG